MGDVSQLTPAVAEPAGGAAAAGQAGRRWLAGIFASCTGSPAGGDVRVSRADG